MDGRRVHARAGEPADALRLDRRPAGAQARLRGRPRRVLARLAAVQPGAEHRAAGRVPRPAGGRRLDAQPGGDVDHRQHVHRPARARAGGRHLGRRVRHLDGARADRGRHDRRRVRLAADLLDQPAGRARRDRPDAAARPRVAGAAAAAVRPRRPGAGDRAAGGADLRDHRGARARMVVAGDRGRVRGVGGRTRRPAGLRAAPRGAADRPAVLPLDALRVGDRRSRWPRSRRSAASCS